MSRSAKAKRKGIRRATGGQKGRRRGTRRQITAHMIDQQTARHKPTVPKSALLPTTTLDLPAPQILDISHAEHLPYTAPIQSGGTGAITIGRGGITVPALSKRELYNYRRRVIYADTPQPNRRRPKIPKRVARPTVGDMALTTPTDVRDREKSRRNTNRVTIKRRWTLIFTGRRNAIRDRGMILV